MDFLQLRVSKFLRAASPCCISPLLSAPLSDPDAVLVTYGLHYSFGLQVSACSFSLLYLASASALLSVPVVPAVLLRGVASPRRHSPATMSSALLHSWLRDVLPKVCL